MLPCPNCKKPVAEPDVRWFGGGDSAAIFTCVECHELAQRVYARSHRVLTQLQTVLKESIRNALQDGKLHLGEVENVDTISKKELLEAIVRLQENKSTHGPATPPQKSTVR